MKKATIISWVLTVFMGLSAIIYFPSIASIFMIFFSILCIPIGAVKQFWENHKIGGPVRIAILVVLFIASFVFVPVNKNTSTSNAVASLAAPQSTAAAPSPSPESAPASTPEPTAAPVETPEPTPEATPESTPEPTPELTPEPTPEPTPEATPIAWDYVLNTNTMKFHWPSCSSVSDIKPANRQDYSGSRDDLIARGYSPCGRCKP